MHKNVVPEIESECARMSILLQAKDQYIDKLERICGESLSRKTQGPAKPDAAGPKVNWFATPQSERKPAEPVPMPGPQDIGRLREDLDAEAGRLTWEISEHDKKIVALQKSRGEIWGMREVLYDRIKCLAKATRTGGDGHVV